MKAKVLAPAWKLTSTQIAVRNPQLICTTNSNPITFKCIQFGVVGENESCKKIKGNKENNPMGIGALYTGFQCQCKNFDA